MPENYGNMIGGYECDSPVLLGRFSRVSEFVKDFAVSQEGNGLDIGAGPGGGYRTFFTKAATITACDADEAVVESLTCFDKRFVHTLGSQEILPFQDSSVDFVLCSFVIHHLNSEQELVLTLNEVSRILSMEGGFFLTFKVGSHDTTVTHYSEFYGTERTLRVFDPEKVIELAARVNLHIRPEIDVVCKELFVDLNYLVNACLVFRKDSV